MEDDKIVVNGIPYKVGCIKYRTKGSVGQTLLDDVDDEQREKCVQYYIASKDDTWYWIKEVNFGPEAYLGETTCEKEAEKEYNRGLQVNGLEIIDNEDSVSSVKYINYEKNRIVQEFCSDYVKYSEVRLSDSEKTKVRKLIGLWLNELPFDNYDLGPTNTLIKITDGHISIKMVDLADSPDKSIAKCKEIVHGVFV